MHAGPAALHIDSRVDAYLVDPAYLIAHSTRFTHVAREQWAPPGKSGHPGLRGTKVRADTHAHARELG